MPSPTQRADRSATGTVRLAAIQHAANAARALAASPPSDVEAHAARKEVKRARAALRLLRSTLSEAVYARDDAALRAAARVLNAVRDARVLLRTLESLRRRHATLRKDQMSAALARTLRRRQFEALRHLQLHPSELAGARAALQRLQLRARRWRVGRHGWSQLAPAFKRIYRAGRRAARTASRRPDVSTLHQWRKKVQYLWHALQILEPLQSAMLPKFGELARRLADCLGEEHDLALLQSALAAFAQGREKADEPLRAAIERRRRSLRSKAMSLGGRLYAPRPASVVKRVGRWCVPRRVSHGRVAGA